MKTLYININGEAIKSDNNIEVIGSAEDSIVESFYISLGEAIAGGATGIKYKPLVADFANVKPNESKSFSDQWQEVKALLLSDNPSGDYEFTLSSEYLDWLKMNATYSTIYYKKYQNQHQAKVKLNLDELYEDTVDAIRRKVIRFLQTNDNYKNYGEFVVNDDAVTLRSLLVRSIKNTFETISFVPFVALKKRMPKKKDWSRLFPFCDLILGQSTISDVKKLNIFELEKFKGKDYCFFLNETIIFSKEEREKAFSELSLSHLDYRMSKYDFPNYWHDILGITWGMKMDDCRDALLKQEAHRITYYGYISPDNNYIIVLIENKDEEFSSLYITVNECPHCHSKQLDFTTDDGKLQIRCKNCNHLRITRH